MSFRGSDVRSGRREHSHHLPPDGLVARHNGLHSSYDAPAPPPMVIKREPDVSFLDRRPAEDLFLEHHERYGYYHAFGCEPCAKYARHITALWRDDPAAFRRAEQEARIPPPSAQHPDYPALLADHRELTAQIQKLRNERAYFDQEYNRMREDRDYWRSRAEGAVAGTGTGTFLPRPPPPLSPPPKGRLRNRSSSPPTYMDQDSRAPHEPPSRHHPPSGRRNPLVAQNSAEFSDPYDSRARYEASSSSAAADYPPREVEPRQVVAWTDPPRDQAEEHPRKRPRTERHAGPPRQDPPPPERPPSRGSSIDGPPSTGKNRGNSGSNVHWPRSEHSLRNIVRRAQAGDTNMQALLRGLGEKLTAQGTPRTPVQRAYVRNYQPIPGGPPTLWSTVQEHIEHWATVPSHRPNSVGVLEDGVTPHAGDTEFYVTMRQITPSNVGTRPFIDKCAAIFGVPGEYLRILDQENIETVGEPKLEAPLPNITQNSPSVEVVKALAKVGMAQEQINLFEDYYLRRGRTEDGAVVMTHQQQPPTLSQPAGLPLPPPEPQQQLAPPYLETAPQPSMESVVDLTYEEGAIIETTS